ncbi:O-antigen ligase family protein [Microbacterium thalli]|uniref:O-antigen ligase family protein n=1 Tax=Microbacterium thalli TaxID=3027921 RepID=UPI002365CEF2|nr:O-antigen ligase family protein [Microbacterium thalli]MDD7930057.1 O-antigen ligase family protein [Microbacterium thalli]
MASVTGTARRAGTHSALTFPIKVASALSVVLAAFIPIYRVLPGNISGLWTTVTLGLLVATVLLGLGGRPKWFGIWVYAGYAALAASVTSSGASGLSATLPVAIQLFIIIGIGPFAVAGLIQKNPRLLVAACISFLVTQTASGIAGIAQLFGADVLGWIQVNERSPGLAGHPNVLGVMSALAILVAVSVLLGRHTRGLGRASVLTVLCLNAGALISTGSLSSMSACVAGVIVLLYVYGYRLLRILFAATLTVLVLWAVLSTPFVSAVLRDPVQRFFQVTGQTQYTSTLEIRSETYESAWESIQRDPFLGRGIDAENAAAREFGTVVHNVFLRSWYQGGLLLAIAIAVILVSVLVLVVKAVAARNNGLAVGVIVVMMSYALTSAFFEQPYYWLPVLAAWATLPAGSMTSAGVTSTTASPSRAAS